MSPGQKDQRGEEPRPAIQKEWREDACFDWLDFTFYSLHFSLSLSLSLELRNRREEKLMQAVDYLWNMLSLGSPVYFIQTQNARDLMCKETRESGKR